MNFNEEVFTDLTDLEPVSWITKRITKRRRKEFEQSNRPEETNEQE